MSVLSPTINRAQQMDAILMTEQVYTRLQGELDRIAAHLAAEQVIPPGGEDDDGMLVLPTEVIWDWQQLSRRSELLQQVLSRASVVVPDGAAIVGSRVLVRDADGVLDTYTLVAPGEAESRSGNISIASPLGRALLGQRAGATTEVAAPDGQRAVLVLEVE